MTPVHEGKLCVKIPFNNQEGRMKLEKNHHFAMSKKVMYSDKD